MDDDDDDDDDDDRYGEQSIYQDQARMASCSASHGQDSAPGSSMLCKGEQVKYHHH